MRVDPPQAGLLLGVHARWLFLLVEEGRAPCTKPPTRGCYRLHHGRTHLAKAPSTTRPRPNTPTGDHPWAWAGSPRSHVPARPARGQHVLDRRIVGPALSYRSASCSGSWWRRGGEVLEPVFVTGDAVGGLERAGGSPRDATFPG